MTPAARRDALYALLLTTSTALLARGLTLIHTAPVEGAGLILTGAATAYVYHHLRLHPYEHHK